MFQEFHKDEIMDVEDLHQLPNTIYMEVFMDAKWELDFRSQVCHYHCLPASDILRDQSSDRCQA